MNEIVINNSPRYLITPTLLNSFNYFMKSESEYALADFEKMIKKEFTTNKYCEAGNMWEDRVCNPKADEANPLVLEVANKLKGCIFQEPVKKEIVVNGINILLYGKTDAIGYDIIKDVKTTSSDYEIGKYNDSMQHRIYMFCSNIKQFEYLITKIKIKEEEVFCNGDGSEFGPDLGIEYKIEPTDNFAEYYSWQDRYESDIYECINNFFEYLKANRELEKAYFELWKCKY